MKGPKRNTRKATFSGAYLELLHRNRQIRLERSRLTKEDQRIVTYVDQLAVFLGEPEGKKAVDLAWSFFLAINAIRPWKPSVETQDDFAVMDWKLRQLWTVQAKSLRRLRAEAKRVNEDFDFALKQVNLGLFKKSAEQFSVACNLLAKNTGALLSEIDKLKSRKKGRRPHNAVMLSENFFRLHELLVENGKRSNGYISIFDDSLLEKPNTRKKYKVSPVKLILNSFAITGVPVHESLIWKRIRDGDEELKKYARGGRG